MKNADEARESGDSRSVDQDRTAPYVLDVIPESAGPGSAAARGSPIYSIRSPGSQMFLTKERSTGIVLRPDRLRASPGKGREYDAPAGCFLDLAGVDSGLACSRENRVISIAREALSALAAHGSGRPRSARAIRGPIR
jgi:AraC family transcriptional regulator